MAGNIEDKIQNGHGKLGKKGKSRENNKVV